MEYWINELLNYSIQYSSNPLFYHSMSNRFDCGFALPLHKSARLRIMPNL